MKLFTRITFYGQFVVAGALSLPGGVNAGERHGHERSHHVCARKGDRHGTESEWHKAFQVGLFGDLPYAKMGYGGVDGPEMQSLIRDMNESHLAFSIFGGDTKDGSSLCTDANVLTEPSKLFNSLQAPVVYVLGDNEWTDCHRTNNGSYDPLERLDFIRRNMHQTWFSFGQHKMKLDRQGYPGQAYSENTRWSKSGVYFVGINMPGSNNNKVNPGTCLSKKSKRTQADCDADNAEYAERNAKNLEWVAESFRIAKRHESPGILIAFQADPGFDWPETEDVNERETLPNIDGFNDMLDLVVREAADFEGEIVLVHGDTHFFKVDKPLLSPTELIPNITRVQTFGEDKVHWVRATVDPNARNVFTFEPMMVPGN